MPVRRLGEERIPEEDGGDKGELEDNEGLVGPLALDVIGSVGDKANGRDKV